MPPPPKRSAIDELIEYVEERLRELSKEGGAVGRASDEALKAIGSPERKSRLREVLSKIADVMSQPQFRRKFWGTLFYTALLPFLLDIASALPPNYRGFAVAIIAMVFLEGIFNLWFGKREQSQTQTQTT